MDPFALATNHLVRRPAPTIPAPPAPAVEVPSIPPDHPHLRPPRRVRGAAADLPAGWKRHGWFRYPANILTLPEVFELRRESRAERQRTKELEAQIQALLAQRDAELEAAPSPALSASPAIAAAPDEVEVTSSLQVPQPAGPSTRRVPSGPPNRAHGPPSSPEDTVASRSGKAPRISMVHASSSSGAYNTRSQGSAPAINVIGEHIQQQQPFAPVEPFLSESDSTPEEAQEQHPVPVSQPSQFSNRDIFFSDLVQDAAANPYHSAPAASHRPVFGNQHLPSVVPYHAGPPAQQLLQAAPTPAASASAFPALGASPPLVYGQTPQLGVTAPFSSAVSSSDLLDAAFQAEQRLAPDLRQAFELLRMDMDSMQATLRGNIRDLRRHTVSPTDL